MNTTHSPISLSALLRWRVASVLATAAAWILFVGGCATRPPPARPDETTKYTLENTDKFAVIADPVAPPVACTGLQQRTLAGGRLEVVANLKNRGDQPIDVEANCTFSGENPDAISTEAPWQNVTLAGSATQTVRFVAPNSGATKYTIRVRLAR